MNNHDDISAKDRKSMGSLNSRGTIYEIDQKAKMNNQNKNPNLPTAHLPSSSDVGFIGEKRKENTSSNQKFGLFFKRRITWMCLTDREIISNVPDLSLDPNKIQTSKYTMITFLPKNLYEQFSKLANVYFTIIGIMQMIQAISITNGTPTIFLPLGAILAITALKDLFEDLKRHSSDNMENKRNARVLRDGMFQDVSWESIRVGEIIKIMQNEYFPCDVLVINSCEKKGTCFIETKNLDGETNLKHKSANKEIAKIFVSEEDMKAHKVKFSYEKPNPYLYTFTGTAECGSGKKISCDQQSFILRGCSLRNTKFVYGLASYTGHDTKIMLNSVNARAKQSKLEKMMGSQIKIVFLCQIIMCSFAAFYFSSSYAAKSDQFSYLKPTTDNQENFIINLFTLLGNWILIFTNFVPISLLVTLEMVKFIQGIFISVDKNMITKKAGIPDQATSVQSSNLNEELGQVEYIFSDKTGTLTCNEMEFKKCCIGGVSYGSDTSANISGYPKVTNVSFKDEIFFKGLKDAKNHKGSEIRRYLSLLALCHSVIVEEKDGEIIYNASSPDELALLNFARMCGFQFAGLTEENEMILKLDAQEYKYKLLYILEFTSTRKRMSVILRDSEGRIIVMSKGADSVLFPKLSIKNNPFTEFSKKDLESCAEEGLRTLICCQREISPSLFIAWEIKYQEALTSMEDREEKMRIVQDEIEVEFELIGTTAIEDKLQDNVGGTIAVLKESGIKVWVLTGDKIETAINIGYSCKLLSNDLFKIIVDGQTEEEISDLLVKETNALSNEVNYALIVSGDALIFALKPNLATQLMELASRCEAVLCCRVSPKQKQEVVALRPNATTLAIGDGANDVNMITAAHVGIGIRGVEGQQAARASDYAIGEFKFLRRILLFHGRECYRKNALLVCYNFYKNTLLVLPQFWYGFFNFFSGQTLYEKYLYQFFNLFYTSMPIVIYAVLDREFSSSILEKSNKHYMQGIVGELFNAKKFWKWMFAGIWQAFFISLFSYFSLCQNFINNDGSSDGFWGAGTMTFACCVLIANFKVLIFSNLYSPASMFIIFGSILLFVISFAIVAVLKSSELYMKFVQYFLDLFRLHNISGYWMGLFIIILSTTGLDAIYSVYLRRFRVLYLGSVKNLEFIHTYTDNAMKDNMSRLIQGQGEKRITLKKHTGFAFSLEDPADIDHVKNRYVM